MRLELSFAEWMGLLTTVGILATFGLSLYIWLRHTRPSRKVEASLGFVHSPGTSPQRVVVIKFMNERGPAVVIEEVGFECADGSKLLVLIPGPHGAHLPTEPLPTTVPSAHSAMYYYDLEEWRANLQAGAPAVVRAYCRDVTDRCHKSRKLDQATRSALSLSAETQDR